MYYVLYNPLSKSGKDPKVFKKLEKLFKKMGVEHQLLDILEVSNNKEHYIEIIHRTDSVVLVGGDGTLHYFADAIRFITTNGIKMYLYRGGTGNDFGREFKEKLIYISEIVNDLPIFSSDKDKEQTFLNCTGFGIDGEVCHMVNKDEKAKKGINYFKSAIHLFKTFKRFNLEVTVDGVVHEYKNVWFATIMNGKHFGGGMKLNKIGDRFDKTMELYIVHKVSVGKILLIFPLIFLGWHMAFKKVGIELLKGNEFYLKADSPQVLETDGEVTLNVSEIKAKR